MNYLEQFFNETLEIDCSKNPQILLKMCDEALIKLGYCGHEKPMKSYYESGWKYIYYNVYNECYAFSKVKSKTTIDAEMFLKLLEGIDLNEIEFWKEVKMHA